MTTLRWDEIHAMQNAGVAWCDEGDFAKICELAKIEAARQEREFDRTGAIRAFVEAAIPLPQSDGYRCDCTAWCGYDCKSVGRRAQGDGDDPFFPVV